MKTFSSAFFVLAFLAGCSPITATYDIDDKIDFSKFKTYNFSEEAKKLDLQELDRERILNAIDREMTARGFTKNDKPDALIDVFVRLEEKKRATATSPAYGFGGYGAVAYGYGGGFSATNIDVYEYVEGTLFVNFIDLGIEKIVWQGRATKTLDKNASGEKKEKNINLGVQKIYTKFPVKPVAK